MASPTNSDDLLITAKSTKTRKRNKQKINESQFPNPQGKKRKYSDESHPKKKAKKPKPQQEVRGGGEDRTNKSKKSKKPKVEAEPETEVVAGGGEEKSKKAKKSKPEPEAEAEVGGEEEEERKVRRAMEDERFAAARSDPLFRRMPRKEAKVAVDSRFEKLLSDPSFAPSAAPVDKRGRRRKRGVGNPMLRYYLNQDEKEKEKKVQLVEEEEETEMSGSSSNDEEEDEDEDEDEYSVGSDIVHYLMASHEGTPMIENETYRLAVVNIDWDHIKAVDLYVVMTSCLPKGGQILSVTIYPSEFGLKCMKIEEVRGPSALVDANIDDREHNFDDGDNNGDATADGSESDSDGDNSRDTAANDSESDFDGDNNFDINADDGEYDSDRDNNKLRTYELNRLRYYYAVVVCDSSVTANHLYKTLDGAEFLKTSNIFDLRFIPDSMEFTHPPRDIATEAPVNYKEPNFETRALQHSRVKLTWDDDEPERKKILRRKFNPDQLDEFNDYLAGTSDEEGKDGENDSAERGVPLPNPESKKRLGREELLALLQSKGESDEEKGDDVDMEITFNTKLEDLSKRILEKKDKPETVWGKYLEKRNEKRKARKKRSKDLSDDDDYSDPEDHDQTDDFFAEELSDTETMRGKRHKAKAKDKGKRKGKDQSSENPKEQEASTAELELLFTADQDGAHGPHGYNLKPKKVKGKKGKEKSTEDKVPDVDVKEDPRFSALFKSHLFALDPTDPQYKRSAAYLRKRSGKQGVHASGEEREDAMDNLPYEDVPTYQEDQQSTGVSQERMQLSSTIRSLKKKSWSIKNMGSR